MPRERLNGIEINYEVHGRGMPLVFAHGYSASLGMWRDHVDALSANHELVIYDTRGHGDSSAPPEMERYGLATDYVADQLALMDHLKIEHAYVGGLSMGGMIAQEFALQHPERVRALLLLDTGPGMGALNRDPTAMAAFQQMRNMMQTLARTQGMGAIVNAMRNSPMAMARAASGDQAPPAVVRHLENMAKMSVDGYLGGASSMQGWAGSLDRLSGIRVPTLVLVGEHDRLLEPSRVIHSRIPGSRFVMLRRAGHGTSMWRPHAFQREVLAFLADVDAGRPVAGERTVD